MILGRPIAKLLDVVTGIAAFCMVAVLAFCFINAKFPLIREPADLEALYRVRDIGVMVVVGLAGLEFALKRSIIIFIVFSILLAVAAVFMFYSFA